MDYDDGNDDNIVYDKGMMMHYFKAHTMISTVSTSEFSENINMKSFGIITSRPRAYSLIK